jgi:multidrug efflux system membrane fusion protein
VVNSNNTVSVRPVVLGVVDGETQAVKSGIDVDEVVVTDGGDRLRDGAAVQLPEATAAEVAKARTQAQAEHKDEGKFPGRRRRNGQGGPGGGPPGGGRPPGGGPP